MLFIHIVTSSKNFLPLSILTSLRIQVLPEVLASLLEKHEGPSGAVNVYIWTDLMADLWMEKEGGLFQD